MALGQSFSLDFIFVSWDYMTIKVPSRPRTQRFSDLKGRHGSQGCWALARLLATLSEGPVQPKDLGALKLTSFPFCLQLPTSKPVLWKIPGSKRLVWWQRLLESFPQLAWETTSIPSTPLKKLSLFEFQLCSSDLKSPEFLFPKAKVIGFFSF